MFDRSVVYGGKSLRYLSKMFDGPGKKLKISERFKRVSTFQSKKLKLKYFENCEFFGKFRILSKRNWLFHFAQNNHHKKLVSKILTGFVSR